MVADQERICKTLGIKDAMGMIPERRTVRVAAEVIFSLWFAVIVFFTVLSDGRLLNLHTAMTGHASWVALSLLAWATWIAFAAMLLVGPWRQRRRLQFYASMATIMFCATLGAYSMLPNSTPDWFRAVLTGSIAGLASIIASWLVRRRAQC